MNLEAPPNTDNPQPAQPRALDPQQKFIARCEARALLWQLGEFTLHEAVDELERVRLDLKINADVAQALIAAAFAAVQS